MSGAMEDGRARAVARSAAVRLARWVDGGERAVVAVSGGLDSMVLLHLLRLAPELPRLHLIVAHFDHRMRPESAEDAAWVEAAARRAGLMVEVGTAEDPPVSEAAARDARYAFLDRVRLRAGARWTILAHHADDQAETVLFRVARGAGIAGLRGMPARRGALLRPLLTAWREDLEAYARAHGIEHRVDPSNRDLRFGRNRLRHEAIPALERVAPGARRALVRLARTAAREERGWRALLGEVADRVVEERGADRVVLRREPFLEWPDGVRARLLRDVVRGLGGALDEAGTRAGVQFIIASESGRVRPLPGGLRIAREFDRIVLRRERPDVPDDRPLEILAARAGEGRAEVGGRWLVARWSVGLLHGEERNGTSGDVARLPLARLAFPLLLRRWRPGDRVRFPYGSKKLKKVLGEARVPLGERDRVVVLADATGRVLWVPRIVRAAGMEPVPGAEVLRIEVRE